MTDTHAVISAFLDDEPFDAAELAAALSDPGGTGAADRSGGAPPHRPAGRACRGRCAGTPRSRWRPLLATAAMLVALAGGYVLGDRRSAVEQLRAAGADARRAGNHVADSSNRRRTMKRVTICCCRAVDRRRRRARANCRRRPDRGERVRGQDQWRRAAGGRRAQHWASQQEIEQRRALLGSRLRRIHHRSGSGRTVRRRRDVGLASRHQATRNERWRGHLPAALDTRPRYRQGDVRRRARISS